MPINIEAYSLWRITGTALKWYYDHWNHSQVPPKKPSHPPYTHCSNPRHEFLTSSQISAPSEKITQRNRINCKRLTSPKVHFSKTIHDRHRPFLIVRLFMHLSANSPKWRLRGPILYTIRWSPIRSPRRDQGIVYKIGPHNRHWDAFAEICINNRTIRHDTKGVCQLCIVLERCTFGEVSRLRFILFLCVYLGWSACLGTMSKIRVWPYCNGYKTGGGLKVVPAIIVTPCLWTDLR